MQLKRSTGYSVRKRSSRSRELGHYLERLEPRFTLTCDVGGLHRLPGDATGNGLFNSSDLIQVFQFGKYETDSVALWHEGDWNDDLQFDSSDLISAFVPGCYETGEGLTRSASWFRPVAPELIASVDSDAVTVITHNGESVAAIGDEWIVTLVDDLLANIESPLDVSERFRAVNADVLGGTGARGEILVRLPSSSADEAKVVFESLGIVEQFEPNAVLKLAAVPNDVRASELWGLNNVGQTAGLPDADIDAHQAWDIEQGSADVIVAVVDTGVDYTHPDLAANIWTNSKEVPSNGIDDDNNGFIDDVHGFDFVNNDGDPMDDNGHGTHVAGTLGAVGNNGVGVVGVSPTVGIMALKFLSSRGNGTLFHAMRAINYATMMAQRGESVRVTNNSWGGGPSNSLLRNAISESGDAGVLFVAASGNSGVNTDVSPHYPAGYGLPNIISVAATDHSDHLAEFSNFGVNTVDVAAPGVSILSTLPIALNATGYGRLSGTSMAAPHVSGIAALVWAYQPSLSMQQVRTSIVQGADEIHSLEGLVKLGRRANALGSLVSLSVDFPDLTSQDNDPSRFGDFDGDGFDNDFLRYYESRGELWVGLWNTDGRVVSNRWGGAGPANAWDWMVADLNGDRRDDVVGFYSGESVGELWAYISTGYGFVASQWGSTSPAADWNWSVAELNGDGHDDLFGYYSGNETGELWAYIAEVDRFAPSRWGNTSPSSNWTWTVTDLNGDSRQDVAGFYSGASVGELWGYLSSGSSFSSSKWGQTSPSSNWEWLPSDVNGDGKGDLIGYYSGASTGEIWVYTSNGVAFVPTHWGSTSPAVDWDWVVVNLDGDDDDDLVGYYFGASVGELWGYIAEDLHFSSSQWGTTSPSADWRWYVADTNGDGFDDVIGEYLNESTWEIWEYASAFDELLATRRLAVRRLP